jgi:D-alanyl-D-alanine carboxypeptidase
MMTAKAHSLGMTHTEFRNANGLPDPNQYTTARDMAALGIALRRDFPQYYGYFATRSFVYGRHRIANHNHLLGHVAGVDGIKTGYTRASGFNIVTSVKIDGRQIVGVVMGGATSRSRDNQMAALIRKYLPRASTRGGELVAESEQKVPSKIKVVAAALPREDAPMPDRRPHPRPKLPEVMALAETVSSPAAQKINEIVDPVSTASTEEKPAAKRAEGWVIQVASTASEADARAFLARTTREAPKVLADASPFTVAFEKNGVTYYRARYSGFASKSEAWDTCGALRKRKIACYAVAQ